MFIELSDRFLVVMQSGLHETIGKGESTVRASSILSCGLLSFWRLQSIIRIDCSLGRAKPITSGWGRAPRVTLCECGSGEQRWIRTQRKWPRGFHLRHFSFREFTSELSNKVREEELSSPTLWLFRESLIKRNAQLYSWHGFNKHRVNTYHVPDIVLY